jgi:hypothetical protein
MARHYPGVAGRPGAGGSGEIQDALTVPRLAPVLFPLIFTPL